MRPWRPCSSKPELLGVALLLVSLACAVVSEGDDAEIHGLDAAEAPRILAESDFSWDTDGWLVQEANGETQPPRDFAHMGKMIKAGDSGAETWYFVAPQKFIGAKRDAYGGRLCFRHGFYEFNSDGKEALHSFDVLITSEAHGLTLGRRGLFPAYSFSSDHQLELQEAAGWLHADSNQPPSRPEMIRLLSKISSIKIRGGMYAGSEDAYIMDVKLVAGPQIQSAHRTSLKTQSIHTDL